MNNKELIMLTLILTIVGLTVFGFSTNRVFKNSINNHIEIDSNTIAKPYSNIDIINGFKIDYNTEALAKPELSYMVIRGSTGSNSLVKTGRPIKEETLKNAKSISDIIENYPSHWITDYNSVTVATTVNGKTIELRGPDDQLTRQQKEIFKTASNLLLVVQYQKENNKNEIQNRQMNIPLIVIPEIEAKYLDGYEKMIHYLKENSLKTITSKNLAYLPQPSISFIINEEGKVENVKLIATSRNEEIDSLLIKTIQNMSNWVPAKNKKGITVKQEFILNIGQNGC